MRAASAIDALNERFAIADLLCFELGAGGLARARVTAPSAEAHVYLHGAHVTHYQPSGERPLLFLSARSRFLRDAAIRGGVPVVFPWFGPRAGHPEAPDHGFARISQWSVESVEFADARVALTLGLGSNAASLASWPHEFRATYRVTVGPALDLELDVENRSRAPLSFEEALHTYLLVSDVGAVAVSGLGGGQYVDKTDAMKRATLPPGPLRLTGETDRVFTGARAGCAVSDAAFGRRLTIAKRGSATTVVWNPWADKAGRMADLGADQWRSMLCVEAANAMDDAVTLAPGARHTMGVVIGATALADAGKP